MTKLDFAAKWYAAQATAASTTPTEAQNSQSATPDPLPRYGVELWTSDDNREMYCFRMDGSAAGYTYVLGYDPDMLDSQKVMQFLRDCGHPGAADAIWARLACNCSEE